MKRILLVDDSALIRAAATQALVEAGYHVDTRDGIEELGGNTLEGFDLILMDVDMPELFGDEVAGILKTERGIATPIYLFSSVDATKLAELAAEARLDGFISKQVGLGGLVARVREILS